MNKNPKKYNLKEIVEDYLKHMQSINLKRTEMAERELGFVMEEVKLFNLLQNNLYVLQEEENRLQGA